MKKDLVMMTAESDQLEASIFETLASINKVEADQFLNHLSLMLENGDPQEVFIMQLASYGLGRIMQLKYSQISDE